MSFRCIHIADVHWRGLTRHEEYKRSFEDLFEQARLLNPDCFVIAGDIVHSKTQGISPELIDCLNWWFTSMSRIAPVHVMLGNHDGLVLNSDRQDAISPILRALNLPKVHLYRDSGTFPDLYNDEINWCVFSPFDEPGYKNIKAEKGKINIALYHGAVWGSHTDSDWMLDGDCKMDLFKPFEFTMLGDIHKTQCLDKEGRIWYPGSTIQQNYGESGEKGFLLWDIESKDTWTVDFHSVFHGKPFVTVDWLGSTQDTVKECEKWPPGARFRIRSDRQLDPKVQRKLSNVLTREHSADEVVYKLGPKNEDPSLTEEQAKIEIEDLTRPAVHKGLLREYAGEESESEEFWKEVDRIIDSLIPKIASKKDARGNKWSIKRMGFDNTFGYGEDNAIDFSKLSGIVGLFGKNRSGKSSIPGTMMYSLFNGNDRGIVGIQHVINTRKQHCAADVTVFVNGKLYRLERQSVRYPSRGKRGPGAMTYLNLYEVDTDGCIIRDLSGEQRKDTEKTVRELIGTSEDFMMTSFAAQGNMNAFIDNGSTERKRILSSFLGLDVFDDLHKLVKDEAAGVKGLLKRLDPIDWVAEIRSEKNKIKELQGKKTDLEFKKTDIDSRLIKLRKLAQDDHGDDWVDPVIIDQKDKNLKDKEKTAKHLTSKIVVSDEEITEGQIRLARYNSFKERVPIEALRRQLETLEDLQKNLLKLESKLGMENSLLKTQRKSVRLLSQVPCGDSFPTCKFIKNSHKNKSLIENQKSLVDEFTSGVEEMSKQVSDLGAQDLRNKINRYDAMLRKESKDKLVVVRLESTKNDSIIRLRHTEQDISRLVEELVGLRLKADEDKSEEMKNLQFQIQKLVDTITGLNDEWSSAAEQIGSKQTTIIQLQKDQAEYDALQVEWKVHDFLIRATSWRGIPTYIMSRNLPAINVELSRILQDIVGFSVEMEVDEKSTDVYLNYGDSRRPIECASGMEKMVSSMALRVALSNISALNKSDIFIVDEGFGSLDPQNIESVTNLLHRLKDYYRLIMIISHVDVIKDSVDDIIEITKVGKDSRTIYE